MKHILFLFSILCSITLTAQVGGWNPELEKEANSTLDLMIEETPKLETFKSKAFGYAVFPKITKAGVGIDMAKDWNVIFPYELKN